MRWIEKYVEPKAGDIRIIKRFLFFPQTLPIKIEIKTKMKTIRQTRWLEIAYIKQRYCVPSTLHLGPFWLDLEWVREIK